MNFDKSRYIKADESGHLIIPPELASQYGIKPGDLIWATPDTDSVKIHRSPHSLTKLYIEPTNQCNLNCRTCIRNDWDEPMGMMSEVVFERIIHGLRDFSPLPTVFFGGSGEPLFHPNIIKMIGQVKTLGASVELITNGTLLTRNVSRELLSTGLDLLWVSLDGATEDNYANIRLGAALPQVLKNLSDFRQVYFTQDYSNLNMLANRYDTQLGIAFVAMKRNIADLPAIIEIGSRFGAQRFLVSNVLPYTRDMLDEVLYYRTLNNITSRHLNLPGLDLNETTNVPIYQTLRSIYGTWESVHYEDMKNHCPFIKKGVGAISWSGNLSPCLPLMHSHTSYLGYLSYEKRFSRCWAIGSVMEHSLSELWHTSEHLAFRERVQAFDFPNCITCGGCDLRETNEEDCFGNKFPTCGGCLWTQGVIQCP